uniref:Type VI crustin cruVI n=1 Tax=Penaeus vannamei TaxID=6689 RepID=A0A7L9R3M0_PENVA|nr:epsin-like [Penaeus vannamei]QOL09974.1 type VI crustin cruVI [Penaeus vannamei]
MLRVLLLCLAAGSTLAQNTNSTNQGNTRIFGLGNLLSGLTGNRPNRPFNGGFNQGGFNQGGFNQGFNPGFNQGGFNQGGFNQGGFGQLGNFVGGLAAGILGQSGFRPPFNQGGFNQFKPGRCPAVRPQCPNTRFGRPQVCFNDFACAGSDKCCFDTCLGERVCKPISNFGK